MSNGHDGRIRNQIEQYGKFKTWQGAGKVVRTVCHSLISILNQIGTTTIDYFSLDVEGAEFFILQSLDWSKLNIEIFTIEVQENRKKIYDFMISKGYERVASVSIDDLYRKASKSTAEVSSAVQNLEQSLILGTGKYALTHPKGKPNGQGGWSQYGQDHHVDKILNQKRNGFFVEIGGYDGESHSNTLFFERQRGWNGLLVEANPFTFQQMVDKDRSCYMINACISRDVPKMQFKIAGGITSAVDLMSQGHGNRIKNQINQYGRFKTWEGSGKVVDTTCHALSQILQQLGTFSIDYFSLDVEGAELFILQSLDWDKLSIDILTIEVQENRAKIHDFMVSKGYKRISSISIDDVYRKA